MKHYKQPTSRKRSRAPRNTHVSTFSTDEEDDYIVASMNGKRQLKNKTQKETIDLSHLSESDFKLISTILKQNHMSEMNRTFPTDPSQSNHVNHHGQPYQHHFAHSLNQTDRIKGILDRQSKVNPDKSSINNKRNVDRIAENLNLSKTAHQLHSAGVPAFQNPQPPPFAQPNPLFRNISPIHPSAKVPPHMGLPPMMPGNIPNNIPNNVMMPTPPGFLYQGVPMPFQGNFPPSYPFFVSPRGKEPILTRDVEVSTNTGNKLSTFDFIPREQKSRGLQTLSDPVIEALQRENIELRKRVQQLEFEKDEHIKTLRIIEELFSDPQSVKTELKKWKSINSPAQNISEHKYEEESVKIKKVRKEKKDVKDSKRSSSPNGHVMTPRSRPPKRRYKAPATEVTAEIEEPSIQITSPITAMSEEPSDITTPAKIRKSVVLNVPTAGPIPNQVIERMKNDFLLRNIPGSNDDSENEYNSVNYDSQQLIGNLHPSTDIQDAIEKYSSSATKYTESIRKSRHRNEILSLPDINDYRFEDLYDNVGEISSTT